jgi:L-histidine N-alpha-methyltransferase
MAHDRGIKLPRIEIRNLMDKTFRSEIVKDVIKGLTASKKFIPSKYFYDDHGSALFDKICTLTEYYPTRTEISILNHAAPYIMDSFLRGDLIELGAGANCKIRILLDAIGVSKSTDLRYVPVDLSEKALITASKELLLLHPELKVLAIIADFTHTLHVLPNDQPKLMVFFGSTLGNLNNEEQLAFLRLIAHAMKPGDKFLIGLDMVKSKKTLEAAYNDSQGITSEFNKNVLNVLNRELNANFDSSHFNHVAFYDMTKKRVEMHLQANRRISIEIRDLDLQIKIEKGETIHTEICKKFSRTSAERIFYEAGLAVTQWFSDPNGWFSLVELKLKDY